MAKKQNKSLFWASYADLMTSLFFLMLTLFIATTVVLNEKRKEAEDLAGQLTGALAASEAEKEQLNAINDAIKDLDEEYFGYSEEYKKHKLKIEVNFPVDQYAIDYLPQGTKDKLEKAGHILQEFISRKTKENENIQFLLIIEGQASKTGPTDHNYDLSYQRAYQLKKYWEGKGINFMANNCEVIIAGSGDGSRSGTGLMREKEERLNQRFLIHILPKPGYTNETRK